MTGLLAGKNPDPILGQDAAEALLQSALYSGRLSHAYLFAGPRGTGRFSSALALSAAFICRESPDGWCGGCRDCLRIMKLQHPDVRVTFPVLGSTRPDEVADLIEKRGRDGFTRLAVPGNSSITIDSVREIQARMALRSYEGSGKVEILLDVDTMKQEAANALLKTLEEPPPGTLMILTAERASGVIPTVRSRAHLVRFGRLPVETIAEIVQERTGVSRQEALRAAASSDGSAGAALEAAREGGALHEMLEKGFDLLTVRDPRAALPAARAMAKTLGLSGSAGLCSGMAAMLHDLRRASLGLRPVFSAGDPLPGAAAWGADSIGRAVRIFLEGEKRIRANVSPAAALAAAFTGAWFELGRDGR
ncbi:MAG TPA: DNA polymerase III subunit [Candidatus Fermentibacter daniensis]|nr:DNA polymerase III subunit [Candidatus Fermentibacter daniensis]HQM40705.1 DNA polymerase III subunit [Candidatus Fermentibacter daniensis]